MGTRREQGENTRHRACGLAGPTSEECCTPLQALCVGGTAGSESTAAVLSHHRGAAGPACGRQGRQQNPPLHCSAITEERQAARGAHAMMLRDAGSP